MTESALGELTYRGLPYRRAGRSGLLLPVFSLGMWHGFGENRSRDEQISLLVGAFERGITHFDNANRYGPPFGSAEATLGEVLRRELRAHRAELTISTKAGNQVADHPYGSGGSRSHLLDEIDRSLLRLGTDHVDIFYSHRFDPLTPIEETARTLADIVRQGKARYIGVSNYPPAKLTEIAAALRQEGVPLALAQPRFSLLDREIETPGHVLDLATEHGFGVVPYSPLAQGLLTDRYLGGTVPSDARAGNSPFLGTDFLTEPYLAQTRRLVEIAEASHASAAQLALRWILQRTEVTSILLGASRIEQLDHNLAAATLTRPSDAALAALDELYPLHRPENGERP